MEQKIDGNTDHLRALRIYLKSRKRILFDNFLAGIAWGVGSVIGATLVIGVLSILFVRTKDIPLIGDIVKKFAEEMEEAKTETKDVILNNNEKKK